MKRLLLFVSLLAAATSPACDGALDAERRTACVDDGDCLSGRVCVGASGDRYGECVDRQAALSDAGEDPTADTSSCIDGDGDGAGPGCTIPSDCDDTDPNVFPGAPERCNGADDDCDSVVDEGFSLFADAEHCGACDVRCDDAHAAVACVGGACVVDSCSGGWWDRDGLGVSGCEEQCEASERACDDGLDDDCDGPIDAADPDCDVESELSSRRFRLLVVRPRSTAAVAVGDVEFDEAGSAATITRRLETAVTSPGRGGQLPDGTLGVIARRDGSLDVNADGATVTLRRSPTARTDFLAGVATNGDLYTLVGLGGRAPDASGEWLAWIVSPLNELDLVPGGAAALGWDDPVELAVLRLTPASGGRGGVSWPFAEYRDSWAGDPAATSSLRPMAYTSWPEGMFALDLLGTGGPTDVEREVYGALVPQGDLVVAAHRFVGDLCVDRAVTAGACMHDPVILAGLRRGGPTAPAALAGDWALVGFTADVVAGALTPRSVDAAITIGASGSITGDLAGTAGTFGSSDTFTPPTLRLDLRGAAVGGGTLVLEGLVSARGYGVFWDQSGETRSRPMHNSLYFIFRR